MLDRRKEYRWLGCDEVRAAQRRRSGPPFDFRGALQWRGGDWRASIPDGGCPNHRLFYLLRLRWPDTGSADEWDALAARLGVLNRAQPRALSRWPLRTPVASLQEHLCPAASQLGLTQRRRVPFKVEGPRLAWAAPGFPWGGPGSCCVTQHTMHNVNVTMRH